MKSTAPFRFSIIGAFGVALIYYATLVGELIPKQNRWREITQKYEMPLPPPGHLTIRADPGERPNHWRIQIRTRDAYAPYFHHGLTGFHPSEPKTTGAFYNMVQDYSVPPPYPQLPALDLPAGGWVTFELRIQEASNGDWIVGYRGLDAKHPSLLVSSGGRSLDDVILRVREGQTLQLDATSPIRLFDLFSKDQQDQLEPGKPIDGCVCYLFPRLPRRKEYAEMSSWNGEGDVR